jgi:hypothetical protein
MSRGSRKDGFQRFVQLNHWMLKSPAWKTLPPNAKAVLLHMWQRNNGTNNGYISYAVREAEEIGVSRSAAARAIEECIDRGFLVCTRDSAFNVKTRAAFDNDGTQAESRARLWRLTAERANGQPATKDFMMWSQKKAQSHQRDAQSRQQDAAAPNAIKEPIAVPPAGLRPPKAASVQSLERDISNIPSWYAPNGAAGAAAEQPDASLWLALLSSSQRACALVVASDQHRLTASKNSAPASLSKFEERAHA